MNGFNLSNISSLYYGSNKCSAIYKGSTLIFRDYSAEYLTFESLEDNNVIGWKKSSSDAPTGTIQYSTDKTTWTSVTPDTTGVTLATLNTGDKLYLKGDNSNYGNFVSSTNLYNYFTSSKTFNIYGNIMSLLNSTSFSTMTTPPNASRTFSSIFKDTKVVDASNLILPATSVTYAGYYSMFEGCTNLTGAPKLPATSLNQYAYNNMFSGCTSLTSAPQLPATVLADYCYYLMFSGCTSLNSIPNLPATTIKKSCYRRMFNNCTSLTSIPTNLFSSITTIQGTDNMRDMFSGCTSLTNAANMPNVLSLPDYCFTGTYYNCKALVTVPSILPATTLGTYCYQYMFTNCAFTTAPELPATTLANSCYKSMFQGCKNLNYIKMLATDISATDCLTNWVSGVASSGTFVKDAFLDITSGTSGIPSNWTITNIDDNVKSNASIKVYKNYNVGYRRVNYWQSMYAYTHHVTPGSDNSKWYYYYNNVLIFSTNDQYVSTTDTLNLNIVITGFTRFKFYINNYTQNNTSWISKISVNKINDNTYINYRDISSSNEHTAYYFKNIDSPDGMCVFENLDPNTKYNICICHGFNSGTSSITIAVPDIYPTFDDMENGYFTNSSDYTEIYGS